MELSPKLYHLLVRPSWFSERYIYRTLNGSFDFNKKNVIDFGCGIGSSCSLFSPAMYLGMDCDSKRIEYARKLYPDYNFCVLEENCLPAPDASADYILIVSVLHHIASHNIKNYLHEFRRVLKCEGKVLIIEPCLYDGCHVSNRYMTWIDKGKYIRTENEYIDIFRKCNYQIQVLERFSQLLLYKKLFFVAALV